MKKLFAEVDKQGLTSELETRLAAIEARLERIDPTQKLEKIEPYKVGSVVYSVIDKNASNPYTVMGYDHRTGRILVQGSDDMERPWPLESVQPFSKCSNASQTSEQAEQEAYKNLDPATREFILGRKRAQIDAITKPSKPSVQVQYRYNNESWEAAK